MGAFYIVLLLAIGFIFSYVYFPARAKLNRLEGWALYIKYIGYSLPIFFVSAFIVILADYYDSFRSIVVFLGIRYSKIIELGFDIQSIKVASLFLLSFVLALLLGSFLNFIFNRRGLRDKVALNISKSDYLEEMVLNNTLVNNVEDRSFIMFSMKSRKVYVGQCQEFSVEHGKLNEIRIIPFLSGYRDKDTLDVNFTVNYMNHYKKYEHNPKEGYVKFSVLIIRMKLRVPLCLIQMNMLVLAIQIKLVKEKIV